MANTAQARKRIRQANKSYEHNKSLRSKLRTNIKKVRTAIESNDAAQAQQCYKAAVPVLDGMVNKGIIHANKAARHKSRLNEQIKKLSA